MRKLWLVAEGLIIACGLLAALMLLSSIGTRPAICLVQVDGMSMYPTLRPGAELLFARLPYGPGDVVLVDVGEGFPIIKRITGIDRRIIFVEGDNRTCSASYDVIEQSIIGVMVCKTPFSSPFSEVGLGRTLHPKGAGPGD